MKVLVADDSMLTRKIVIRYLAPRGDTVVEASNGGEVIDFLNKGQDRPDLILMDWNMPVLDGYQVLTMLQKDNRYGDIPIVMLTSESDDLNRKKALDAGARGYITKPFNADDLLTVVDDIL